MSEGNYLFVDCVRKYLKNITFKLYDTFYLIIV